MRKRKSCMKCSRGEDQRECRLVGTGSGQRCLCWCGLRSRHIIFQRNISFAMVGPTAFVKDGTFPDADAPTRKSKIYSSGCIIYGDSTGGLYISLRTLRTILSTGTVLNFHKFRRATQRSQIRPAASQNLSLTPHMRATQIRLKLLLKLVTTAASTAVLPRRALKILRKSWYLKKSKGDRIFFFKNSSRNSTCYLKLW